MNKLLLFESVLVDVLESGRTIEETEFLYGYMQDVLQTSFARTLCEKEKLINAEGGNSQC